MYKSCNESVTMVMNKDLKFIINNFLEDHLINFPVYIVQISPIILVNSRKIDKSTKEDYINHKDLILNALKEIEHDRREKLIIFPELTMIPEFLPIIERFSLLNNAYIISGSFYKQNRNICKIITPFHGSFTQEKIQQSKYELVEKLMSNNEIMIFQNTRIGSFAVIICLDFTDINLIAPLRGKIDYLIVIACNPSHVLFNDLSKAFTATLSSYIIYANATKPKGSKIPKDKYGRSGLYGPFKSGSIQLKAHFEPRMICDMLDLQAIKNIGGDSLIGTVDVYRHSLGKDQGESNVFYQKNLSNGITKALEIIQKEISLENYNEAILISRNFAIKLETINTKQSSNFYLIIAILYSFLKKKGKYIAVIMKLKQLLNNFDINTIELSNDLLFLKNFFPTEIENILAEFKTIG